jgi:hypothetical protein
MLLVPVQHGASTIDHSSWPRQRQLGRPSPFNLRPISHNRHKPWTTSYAQTSTPPREQAQLSTAYSHSHDDSNAPLSSSHSEFGRKRRRSPEDDENDENDGKRQRHPTTMDPAAGRPRFACPYFKRSPMAVAKIRSCSGPGWNSIHRVKYAFSSGFAARSALTLLGSTSTDVMLRLSSVLVVGLDFRVKIC